MTMGLEARLTEELALMEDLRRQSGFIDFVAKSDPPDEYVVTFTCRGMVDPDVVGEEHVACISLPADYPFGRPPAVRFLTKSFHPNIAALIQMGPVQAQIQELLRRAPDPVARQRVQEEILKDDDLFKAKVCLDTLDHNWSPSITLDRICIELGEMIQYKRYNLDDPLNHDAVRWTLANRERLPVDPRSLLDLRALAGIRILSEMEIGGSAEEVAIHVLGEESGHG
jgi:ubiquitin-protein ligase